MAEESVVYWRVASKLKTGAGTHYFEDYLTETTAIARAKRLEQLGRDVCEPYQVRLQTGEGAS